MWDDIQEDTQDDTLDDILDDIQDDTKYDIQNDNQNDIQNMIQVWSKFNSLELDSELIRLVGIFLYLSSLSFLIVCCMPSFFVKTIIADVTFDYLDTF